MCRHICNLCVYTCVCICECVSLHIRVHMCTYAMCVYMCMSVHIRVYVCICNVCAFARVCTCVYVFLCVRICTCVSTYTFECEYACARACVCAYTDAFIYNSECWMFSGHTTITSPAKICLAVWLDLRVRLRTFQHRRGYQNVYFSERNYKIRTHTHMHTDAPTHIDAIIEKHAIKFINTERQIIYSWITLYFGNMCWYEVISKS